MHTTLSARCNSPTKMPWYAPQWIGLDMCTHAWWCDPSPHKLAKTHPSHVSLTPLIKHREKSKKMDEFKIKLVLKTSNCIPRTAVGRKISVRHCTCLWSSCHVETLGCRTQIHADDARACCDATEFLHFSTTPNNPNLGLQVYSTKAECRQRCLVHTY